MDNMFNNLNDEEFIISTSEELYELAKLSQYYDFKARQGCF